jgi:hypoxanthine phosphoribosyltransferase
MNKVFMNYTQLQGHVLEILRQMQKETWMPDYVVGITRGGLLPAALISQYLDIPMYTIKIALRDGNQEDCESNAWMTVDAFEGKNILVIDDINDTGATIGWIRQDWESGCNPHSDQWPNIWHNNVKFAMIVNNTDSLQKTDYDGMYVTKSVDPAWIVFPTEDWWNKNQ